MRLDMHAFLHVHSHYHTEDHSLTSIAILAFLTQILQGLPALNSIHVQTLMLTDAQTPLPWDPLSSP